MEASVKDLNKTDVATVHQRHFPFQALPHQIIAQRETPRQLREDRACSRIIEVHGFSLYNLLIRISEV